MPQATASDVLLVEDDEVLAGQLAGVVASRGRVLRHAKSVAEGLRLARETLPGVIVSDVRLPDGDGRELLATIRSDHTLKTVQFVLMTGYHHDTPQRAGMNLGADDYLAKPFTMADFVACIESRLERAAFWQRTLEQKAVDHLRGMASLALPHEFFTPLAGILGFSELLLADVEENRHEQYRESLEHIQMSAERLHRTLQNYIFILQIMDGPREAETRAAETPLEDLCPELEQAVEQAAERHERSSDLELICEAQVGERLVSVTPSEFLKIADELVDNALKFSSPGQPVVVVLEKRDGRLHLAVRDRGRGLAAEQLESIGAFRQFDRTRFEQQGLGLGLTIAQHLVSRSDGHFSIASSPAGGTEVSVEWSLADQD